MIATGTDIKPLECVFFMRDIKSATYFEQMKGRGARSIDDASFQQVTIGAKHKERFVIVDAVGVTEHPLNDATVLDRQKSVPLEKLLEKVANRELSQDDATTLASRISRMGRRMTEQENSAIAEIAGMPLEEIADRLIRAIDVDAIKAAELKEPDKAPEKVLHDYIQKLAEPLAENLELRTRLVSSFRSHYLYRDEVSPDILIGAGGVVDTGKAQDIVTSWSQYLEDNKDEITAIQLLYSRPKGAKITFKEINDLIQTIRAPHPEWTPEVIWKAYTALQKTNKSMQNSTADLVSLIRFTLGVTDELEPFAEVVEHRYANWIEVQKQQGVSFTEQQLWWLENIKNAICNGVSFSIDQLDMTPFNERGGSMGMAQTFPNALELLTEINQELSA
jgi:type I restriction enzyme R subunit